MMVVSANRLIEGDAVWLTADGGFTPRIEAAAVFEGAQAEAALAGAAARQAEVVGAALAPVEMRGGVPVPTHFREAFRTRGPSNYDHGKQAG
ncbi:MAG: DUF2849 domain-containing protein [Paracoccaceae bacterium]